MRKLQHNSEANKRNWEQFTIFTFDQYHDLNFMRSTTNTLLGSSSLKIFFFSISLYRSES